MPTHYNNPNRHTKDDPSYFCVYLCFAYCVQFCSIFLSSCSKFIYYILFDYRDPRGYSKSKVCVVVVCGHDESPAYRSWLRPEASFFFNYFKVFLKKWRNMSKSMTHPTFWARFRQKWTRFDQKWAGFHKRGPVFKKGDDFPEIRSLFVKSHHFPSLFL